MDRRNRVLISFLGGIIVGFSICYFWLGGRNPVVERELVADIREESGNPNNPAKDADNARRTGVESETSAMRIGENAVAVLEQKPGMTVFVSLVAFGESGWLAIHDSNDGAPGRILGARRLQSGEHSQVTVELLRGTEDGHNYIAVLHSDDGDGVFDYAKDTPLIGFDGNPITMEFEVSTNAPESDIGISI